MPVVGLRPKFVRLQILRTPRNTTEINVVVWVIWKDMLRWSMGFKIFMGIKIWDGKGVKEDWTERECLSNKVLAILAGYPGVSILRLPEMPRT